MKTSLKNAELVNTVLRKMMMIMFIVGQEMENVNTDHINQEKITMASIRSGIGENMVEKPLYKSVPTMRNYEDYISECDYAKRLE